MPHLPPPVHKTKVPLAMASSLFRAHELPSSHSQSSGLRAGSPERDERPGGEEGRCWLRGPGEAERGPWHDERHHCASGGDGLAPARQLMDVSQLLRLYQARGWGALPAEDLLLYLKRQEHGRYQPGGRGGGSDGRSLDPWETAQAGEGGLGAVHREASVLFRGSRGGQAEAQPSPLFLCDLLLPPLFVLLPERLGNSFPSDVGEPPSSPSVCVAGRTAEGIMSPEGTRTPAWVRSPGKR